MTLKITIQNVIGMVKTAAAQTQSMFLNVALEFLNHTGMKPTLHAHLMVQ